MWLRAGPVGDQRPRASDLPPAMVALAGGSVQIGSTAEEAEQAGLAYERYFLDRGEKGYAEFFRTWPAHSELNEIPVPLGGFAIRRYPVTNAQYALFIDDGGYDPAEPWWDDAARAWLPPTL